MNKNRKIFFTLLIFSTVMLMKNSFRSYAGHNQNEESQTVQAEAILTVSESKRLIAKAIAQSTVVKNALKDGTVIVTKGTTTTYVAEEILNDNIPRGAFVLGRTQPEKSDKKLESDSDIDEIVIVKGKRRNDLTLAQAVQTLKAGDVVIKGANALNYSSKLAAGLIGAPNSGTTGTIIPYITGAKAKLIIPVGLEKEIGDDLLKVVRQMQQPIKSLNYVPSMFLFTGDIITEIEALEILAEVTVSHIASGGINGAEGAVRLLMRGPEENVKKALEIIEEIQGEPPFVR